MGTSTTKRRSLSMRSLLWLAFAPVEGVSSEILRQDVQPSSGPRSGSEADNLVENKQRITIAYRMSMIKYVTLSWEISNQL
jgi:hypothetical protein